MNRSYSALPGRGGAPAGRPPAHCGITSPMPAPTFSLIDEQPDRAGAAKASAVIAASDFARNTVLAGMDGGTFQCRGATLAACHQLVKFGRSKVEVLLYHIRELGQLRKPTVHQGPPRTPLTRPCRVRSDAPATSSTTSRG